MRESFGVLFVLAAVCLAACGGSVAGTDLAGAGSSPGIVSQPQTGRVALMLADSSTETMGGVYVTFTKVSLVPADGGDPVVIFESEDGKEVNFSELDDEDLLFAVADDVEAQEYSKIVLAVKSIRVVGGPCEDFETTVEDDQIELVPDESIDVAAGDTLVLRLAMDSENSVQIDVDGENEVCTFDPVVKVQIQSVSPPEPQDCPTSATGTVSDIELNIHNRPVGFTLDLGEGNGEQAVTVGEGTGYFDNRALPTDGDLIALGAELTAVGRLDEDSVLAADVVYAGEVLEVSGTVLLAPRGGVFVMEADEDGAVVGETAVQLFDPTLILFDCQDATAASLTRGARVTVTGKLVPGEKVLRAVEVSVKPVVIHGALTSAEKGDDGWTIKVRPTGVAVEFEIFVPSDVGIHLAGDGAVPDDLLDDLLACGPLAVTVALKTDESSSGDSMEDMMSRLAGTSGDEETLTASDVRVAAENLEGEVSEVDADGGTVVVGDTLVALLDGATIIDLRNDEALGDLGDLEAGDRVRVFGLANCEDRADDAADFFGFVLLILAEEKPTTPPPTDRPYEGCGHGYWKNHPDAWPADYRPGTKFGDVFANAFPGATLMDVLRQGGGGLYSLGRETVAALLNAASEDIHYRFTVREVIAMFNEAVEDHQYSHLKERFEYWNERGCHDDGEDRDDDHHHHDYDRHHDD